MHLQQVSVASIAVAPFLRIEQPTRTKPLVILLATVITAAVLNAAVGMAKVAVLTLEQPSEVYCCQESFDTRIGWCFLGPL